MLFGLLALLLSVPARCQYVTLTGTLQGANGLPAANNVISLQPTQMFFVAGSSPLVVVPLNAQCATSVDGSVVSVPNPLNSPQGSAIYSGGTLGAGNYYTQIAWYDAAGHITLVGPEIQTQLTGTGTLQILPPASGLPQNASGMKVYIGATSGSETLQGTTSGSAAFAQSTALTSGAAEPSTNNTVCQVIANDAGWPTGTGYVVGMTAPNGATYPGYPMQWQLLGAGNTYNLGNGLPLYNGTVTYPSPILALPYNHGPQSISGPLSLAGYNFSNVGKVGVGTSLPAWGVDAEGSGLGGAINANTGYLYNGAAASDHVLLGNGSYYVDSATIPYSILSGAPTLYYQTTAANGSAQTHRPTLNFSSRFTLTDSASPAETTVAPVTTGSEADLVTAAAAGTTNHCVKWLSTGGIGDYGASCAAFTTSRTCVTAGCYQVTADGTVTEWLSTGALNNNTPTTITLPVAIPTAVMSITCTDSGGRVQSGNNQPVGANVVGLSAPYSSMYVNTPSSSVTAYCTVVGY